MNIKTFILRGGQEIVGEVLGNPANRVQIVKRPFRVVYVGFPIPSPQGLQIQCNTTMQSFFATAVADTLHLDLDDDVLVGPLEPHKAVIDQYIQATTGIQLAS